MVVDLDILKHARTQREAMQNKSRYRDPLSSLPLHNRIAYWHKRQGL
jgi:hypothetical protein